MLCCPSEGYSPRRFRTLFRAFKCSPVIEQSSSQILNHFDTTAPDAPNQSVHPTDSQAGGPRRRLSLQLCGFASCHSGCTPAESPPRGSGMERQKPLTLTYHAYLGVRFYPLDPTCITNEQTRRQEEVFGDKPEGDFEALGYQIFLQVRADLISGRMQIEKELFITLCGLILQSDCGDYGEDRLGSSYVRRLLKMPEMDREMENRIKAKHVECRCRQPALVEYQLLDKVKHCISYGQTKFAVKEVVSNLRCLLGLGPVGLTIEDAQQNTIRFSWLQVFGFSRKNKQLLVKILDGTEKFTYHYVVEESIDCCDAIRLCKEYFEFYKSELSRSLYRHSLNTSMPTDSSPSTQLTNFTISAVGQRLPPYTRSSVATPYGVVSNTDPASTVIGEPNSDDRGKYLDCIRYPQSSAMMSAQAVQYAKVPSVVFDSQSQTQRQLIQGQDGFVQWYPPVLSPQPIPPNPYHVPPSTVFYRPQGCGTVTDLGDTHSIAFQSTRTDPVAHQQARQYLVRSTDGRHGTSRHTVEGDQRDSHLSRYHRRSFPKTKHYLIDEPSTILQNSCRIIDTSTASARTESIRNVVDHRRSRPSRIPQRVGTLPTDECLYARLANMNVSDSQYLPSESRRMDRDTVDYNPSLNDNDLISRQDNYYVRPQKELRTHLCPQGVLTPPRNYRQCDLLQNYEICDDPQSSGQPSYSSSGGYTCGKSGDQNNYDPTTTDPPLSTESRVIQSEPFRYSHSSSQSRTSQARKCSLDTVDTAGGTFESQCCGQTQNQTEESQPPSLLRSSGQTSEICDSLCTSLQQFQLPPSPPHSAEKSGQKVLSSAEKYPESNLPSPPSQSFLNELHRPVKTTVAANNSAQAIHPMKLDCATEEHSTDTGFSSRRDSQRYRANGGRRLPLTPPERMSQQRLQCISPDLITGRRTPQPTIVYSPSPTSELPSIVMFRNNQSVSAVEPDELHNILSPRDQQPFDMFGDTLHDVI